MSDFTPIPAGSSDIVPAGNGLSRDQIELVKRTIAKNTTDDELALFIATCNRTGLDPFARQIYAVMRYDWRAKTEVMSIQVSIDGFRLLADRACARHGWVRSEEPTAWCGPDGVWLTEWIHSTPPTAARYTALAITQQGIARYSAVARFDAYAQRKKDGGLTQMWASMPDTMIAKCAEALALRKAFPAELSGLYTTDEMGQAGNPVQATPEPLQVRGAALPPGSVSAAAAKKRLVDVALGDIDIAREVWGDRGSSPITEAELDDLLEAVQEALTYEGQIELAEVDELADTEELDIEEGDAE